MTSETLYMLVEELLKLPRLTTEAVAGLLSIPLTAEAAGTPYFAVHQGTRPPEVTGPGPVAVELRTPRPSSPAGAQGAKDGILIVDLEGLTITMYEVGGHYGKPARMVHSAPDDPDHTVSLWYAPDGGELRFIFDAGQLQLRGIVIDRTELR